MSNVQFVHGKESGPWGNKIRFLANIAQEHGLTVDSLDFSDLALPEDRVTRLLSACENDPPELLVGSSMGGWVAASASNQLAAKGILLLAPAFYLPGFEEIAPGNGCIEIVHGWKDDVVPCANSIRFARTWGCTLHLIDDDHRLSHRLDLLGEYFAALIERVL